MVEKKNSVGQIKVITEQKMLQNVEDHDRLIDDFEAMFMNIPGDLDFS